jgi:adenosine deaminase
MYQARKVISVCIDLALFIEVYVPSQERDQCVYRSWPFYWSCTSIKRARSIHTLITFLAWYMYFNKKVKIDTHTDHFPGLVHILQWKGQERYSVYIDLALFIEVHVPSQESDQCVYRSCPFHWSTCTKRGKWSVCVSILPFLLKYLYQARKLQ